MKVSQTEGHLVGGSYNDDYRILGSIFRSTTSEFSEAAICIYQVGAQTEDYTDHTPPQHPSSILRKALFTWYLWQGIDDKP